MPPQVAALVYTIGIIGLFLLDRDRDSKCSMAVWIPVVWLFIGASKNISTWLAGVNQVSNPDQYLDGSPMDALLLTVLLAAALTVLAMRARRSSAFLRNNGPILIFLCFCLLSVVWSDFAFVAFKRWTKALGNVAMVFVLLTDENPSGAVKRFLSWTGFVLIPLSLLFIKYYPSIGRAYDHWSGAIIYLGAVGEKNGLGYDCLIFGLGAVWSLVGALRKTPFKTRFVIAPGVILGTSLWLFHWANSATSYTCFLLGTAIILLVTFFVNGKTWRMHLVAGTLVLAAAFTLTFPDAYAYIVQSVGRKTDLTGRTDLWDELLQMQSNHWLGTGYESFFLGDRLSLLWSRHWWHPQEAHNGYLEIYLTLGYVGLGLLAIVALSGYKNVIAGYRRDPHLGALRLALLFVALIYNSTEAAFKIMHPVMIMFLLAVIAVPITSVQEKKEELPVPSEDIYRSRFRKVEKPVLARNQTAARPVVPQPSRVRR